MMSKQQLVDAIALEKKRHQETIEELYSKLRVFELEEQFGAYDKYKKRKEGLDVTGSWLKENQVLRIGDLVRVTGSRSGPYRNIIGITNSGIVGSVATLRREKNVDGTFVSVWRNKGTVTEQGFNKITAIFRSGKFVPVKELMEQPE